MSQIINYKNFKKNQATLKDHLFVYRKATSSINKINSIKSAILYLFIFCVVISVFSNKAFAQSQIIGSLPGVEGGFEPYTAGAITSAVSTTTWHTRGTGGVISSVVTSGARSGNKYITYQSQAGTGKYLMSPSVLNFTTTGNYVIQYHYKTAAAANLQAYIFSTTTTSNNIAASLAVSASWTKSGNVINLTAASTSATGMVGFKDNVATTAAIDFDDIVVYAGNALDITAPDPPTNFTISSASATSLSLSWNSPTNGVDGGGYVLIRSAYPAAISMNPNGIYAVGNTTADGAGTVIGIFSSSTTSYSDNGLSSGGSYYYTLYSVDKAFNYCSSPPTGGGTPNGPIIAANPISLNSFTQLGLVPTAFQSFIVTGSYLTANVQIVAPSGYEISSDGGITWISSASNISLTSSNLPATINVRLNASSAGNYSGNIQVTSTGANSVNVSCNGTATVSPTLYVSSASLTSFGSVLATTTSPTILNFSVSGLLLSPAAGNIAINAPAGYQISTSTTAGFSSSLSLAYINSALSSTTIYVMFTPTSATTYNSNITNSGGGATTVNVVVSGTGVLQQVGDFGTIGSGLWSAIGIWAKWDGTGFNTAVTVVPGTNADNVWVSAGHAVTLDAGKTCKNLIVNGSLLAGGTTSTPVRLKIYGQIVQVNTGGYIGSAVNPTGDLADAIGFDLWATQIKFNGNGGAMFISQIRPGIINAALTIDHDMTLTYHGSGNAGGVALQSNALDGFIITINEGKTLTLPTGCYVGNGSSGSSNPSIDLTINVNGTLNMLTGTNLFGPTTATNGAGKKFVLNIGSAGFANIYDFYPNGSVAPTTMNLSSINIATGGLLSINNSIDLRKPEQTITGGGTFSLGAAAKIKIGSADGISATGENAGHILTGTRALSTTASFVYERADLVSQITGSGLPATVKALTINNLGNITLTNDLNVTDSIVLTAGKINLYTKNIITRKCLGGSASNYIVTNGTGSLKMLNIGTSQMTFPVGVSTYNPVTLSNAGTIDNYSVIVQETMPPAFINQSHWPVNYPRIFQSISSGLWNSFTTWQHQVNSLNYGVNRIWKINEDIAGGSNATLSLQWNAPEQYTGFSNADCGIVKFNGSSIDYSGNFAASTGVNPYVITGTNLTSFTTNQFGVASLLPGNATYQNSTSLIPGVPAISSFSLNNVVINTGHTVSANSGGSTYCKDLTINGSLNLSALTGDNLFIAGNWVRNVGAVLNQNGRLVTFQGNSDNTIAASGGQIFDNLCLNKFASTNKLTLNDNVSITQELKVTAGTFDLFNSNVTLLSDANNTANFATLGTNGLINYSAAGRFVVQRYIHTGNSSTRHAKSWQFLCAPIDPSENISIKQSWMENAGANLNPNPGYGTQIVGLGGSNNGFDVATSSTSIKTFNPAGQWDYVTNTSQNVSNDKGYMIFVRGSRAILNATTTADSTVLRATGKLMTGNINGPVVPVGAFQSVANPYSSAINFNLVTKTNLQDYIWVFDPNYGGTTYGLGGFNTIDISGIPQLLTPYYSNISQNRILQSGQAFLVRSSSATVPGTISFKETDKVSGSRLVSRASQSNSLNAASVRSTLFFQGTNGDYKLSDGNLVLFDDVFSADQNDDALKYFNSGDNFSLYKNGNYYAIEKRKTVLTADTISYSMLVTRTGSYNLKINISNWANSLTNARLIDKFTYLTTAVSLTDSMVYTFEVNSNAASKAADRFMLVFNNAILGPLPVRFVDVKAETKDEQSVLVNWTVSQEVNINKYEVEKSDNGADYFKIGEQIALNNSLTHTYDFTDNHTSIGVNYYRIKSIDSDGTKQLSKIVKIIRTNDKELFTIYPNPVINETITITANQIYAGKYFYQIADIAGKKLMEGQWLTDLGMTKKITLSDEFAQGIYILTIKDENGKSYNYTIRKK